MGWKKNVAIDRSLNDSHWLAAANDKILCYRFLKSLAVPIPEMVALYSSARRRVGGEPVFSDPDAFIRHLQDEVQYPVFMKPNAGTYGRSSFLIKQYDPDIQSWRLGNDTVLSVRHLRQMLDFSPYDGMLVQKVLQQDSGISAFIGSTVSCVRLMIMLNAGNPYIFCAFWKIGTGKNMTDNFSMGKNGNLLGWIDIETGAIKRIISGIGEQYRETAIHPDTDKRIKGHKLPGWKNLIDQCCRAAVNFQGLGLQHWDIAFTDKGPVVIEVNTDADIHLIQLAGRCGLFNDRMKQALSDAETRRKKARTDAVFRAQNPELGL